MRERACRSLANLGASPLFMESRRCSISLFYAIPDAKPLRTFAGIALVDASRSSFERAARAGDLVEIGGRIELDAAAPCLVQVAAPDADIGEFPVGHLAQPV